SIPPKMVELVAGLGSRHVADNLGIRRRFRIDIDDCDVVGGFSVGIEGRDIGERFGRGLRRLARRGVKTWIRRPGGHVILSSRDWLLLHGLAWVPLRKHVAVDDPTRSIESLTRSARLKRRAGFARAPASRAFWTL